MLWILDYILELDFFNHILIKFGLILKNQIDSFHVNVYP